GETLHYILATHQEGAADPVTGKPFLAGAILNGGLNWSNVDSFGAGYAYSDPISNQVYTATIDTKWSSWFSTTIGIGYDNFTERRINPGFSFIATGLTAGVTSWSAAETPSDSWQPARTKGGRLGGLVTRDFWRNQVKTQTFFGADYIRTDFGQIAYNWY